jgi:hypothetical protein
LIDDPESGRNLLPAKQTLLLVARHAAAIFSLLLANRYLTNWYTFTDWRDHLRFSLLLVGGILLAGGPLFWEKIRSARTVRLLIVAVFLFLSLPWGEWLHLNIGLSRQNWSRLLFEQTLYVYALVAALRMFPGFVLWLRNQFQRHSKTRDLQFTFWAFPLIFFLASAWIGVFLYQKTPLAQDTSAYLFQAKVFASGKFYAPAPPVPEFFTARGEMLAMKDGRWFQIFSPGLPLLLSVFVLLHLEWFVCPLLGALTLTLWMHELRRTGSRSTAVLFGLFFLFSPFLLLMSSTVMVHNPELFLSSAIIILSIRQSEQCTTRRSLMLSALMAAAVLTRGFSILPFLAPVLAVSLWTQVRKGLWKDAALITVGLILGAGLLAFYQKETTGSPWIPGYLVKYSNYHYGFGPNLEGMVHTPARGLENTSNEILGLNFRLTGWHTGWLPFLISFVMTVRRLRKWDIVLALSCVAITTFYYFFVIQDLVLGPRFVYVTAPILLLFLCRSFESWDEDPNEQTAITPALVLCSLLLFVPLGLADSIAIYRPLGNQAVYLKSEVEKVASAKTIVFLDHRSRNFVNWNDPFLRGPVLYCLDLGERNQKLFTNFPDYQPRYFRLGSGGGFGEISYHMETSPDASQPGDVSILDLAMTVEQASSHPTLDLFDVLSSSTFDSPDNRLQYKSLEQKEKGLNRSHRLQYQYALGLIHTAKLVLLPLCEYQDDPRHWLSRYNKDEFRKQHALAVSSLKKAKDLGISLLQEFEKLDRRIDRNNDHILSDEEIAGFLSTKISSDSQ